MELKQFKISVLPLRNKLLNYARKLTESPDDAEDAVQEVLLKLWNKRLELEQYRNRLEQMVEEKSKDLIAIQENLEATNRR